MESQNRTYRVLLHPQRLRTKQEARSLIGKIKSTILKYRAEVTIKELADQMGNQGCSVALCEAAGEGTFKKANWRSQGIYALDFDNMSPAKEKLERPYYLTGEEAVEIAKKAGFTPAFGYFTLSSSKDFEKFRLVFALDEPCTTKEEHQAVYAALSSLYMVEGEDLTDGSCREESRVFFGGNCTFFLNEDAVCSKDALVDMGSKLIAEDKGTNREKPSTRTGGELIRRMALEQRISDIQADLEAISKCSSLTRKSLRSPVFTRVPGNTAKGTRIAYIYILDNTIKLDNSLAIPVPNAKIPKTRVVTGSFDDYAATSRALPWNMLLDVPMETMFSCVLPDHEDKTPSAHMIEYEGKVIYKCFGKDCGERLDIFQFLEKISGCSFLTAARYISLVFDIDFETQWQKDIREQIQGLLMLIGSDYYASQYEVLEKTLQRKNLKILYTLMLNVLTLQLLDRQVTNTDTPMFYMSATRLYKILQRYGYSKSLPTLMKTLRDLAHLGLIEIIEDSEIPNKDLANMRRIQAKNHQIKRMSCYRIPLNEHQVFRRAEQIILEDKAKNVRARATRSREGLLRSFGTEAADAVFVQDIGKEGSQEVDKFYKSYLKVAKNLLQKKGWTTEKEILSHMRMFKEPGGNQKREKYSQYCLPQLLQELGAVRKPFTKALDEKYGINSGRRQKLKYGASRVIYVD